MPNTAKAFAIQDCKLRGERGNVAASARDMGHRAICIYCGAMGRIRQTGGWILPICEREEGYESAHELEPLSHDDGFCVWICRDPDGTERSVSYKDLVVGGGRADRQGARACPAASRQRRMEATWQLSC